MRMVKKKVRLLYVIIDVNLPLELMVLERLEDARGMAQFFHVLIQMVLMHRLKGL